METFVRFNAGKHSADTEQTERALLITKGVRVPNALFENKKKQLDEKYSKLFYLSEREDQLSDELRKINEEYWKLKEMYDREYKKLLREWSKSYEIFSE